MLLYNSTTKKQSIQAFGNWFTFSPGQIKSLDERFGRFIIDEKRMYGVVELPESFLDPVDESAPDAAEQKQERERVKMEKTVEGRTNRINHLKFVIHNEEVSLRQDLEKSGLKINPNVFASANYVEVLSELSEYKKADDDVQRERMDKIQKIKKELNRE